MREILRVFLLGSLSAASFVAALFFARFWRETLDRLFAFFAIAFALLAINWCALAFIPAENEARTIVYVVRLVGFLLILTAIVDKNRSG
jgi:hypothetical protein